MIMLTRNALWLTALGFLLAGFGGQPAINQEKLKPYPKAETKAENKQNQTQDEKLRKLREQLQWLEQETAKLRRQIRKIERSQGVAPDPDRRAAPLPGQGFRHPAFPDLNRFFRNQGGFPDLEALMRDLRKSWPDPKSFHEQESQGERISMRQTPAGIRVEIQSQNDQGKEEKKVYEARDAETFQKLYPEVVKKYGLNFGDNQTFSFRFRPPSFGSGLKDDDQLPRAFQDLQRLFERKQDVPAPARGHDRLGVWVEDLPPERGKALGLETGQGLVVRKVEPDSLAKRLGLRPDDVLLSMNGQPIQGVESIKQTLGSLSGSDAVMVDVARGHNERLTLKTRKSPGKKL
jgi:PDZ domain-containing protein